MLTNLEKSPFPYFGAKADAAEAVWEALGDVPHYVEPFGATLAVLLRRPHPANRTYFSETVNDSCGFITNVWRSIQLSPDATAEAASRPVIEADLHAIHLALLRWRSENQLEHLMGDPTFHDPVMAGWWIWGQSCWIGSGWCSGDGAWTMGDDGRITRRDQSGEGVRRKMPNVNDSGHGVNRPQVREEGVGDELDFHPMVMPELLRWFRFLSARLRHVRILNGDWRRAVTNGATKILTVRQGDGPCGIFLDPPYGEGAGRHDKLYAHDSLTVAAEARDWALSVGDDPQLRIVFAGYDGEHGDAFARAGWREREWFRKGFLKGGMANQSAEGHQQGRERLWLSPHCLGAEAKRQGSLFGGR